MCRKPAQTAIVRRVCILAAAVIAAAPAAPSAPAAFAADTAPGVPAVPAPPPPALPADTDPFELLTLRLPDIFRRYGPPASVYAVRGAEPWQDDVVLAYKGVDFYLFKDQVWQVGLEKTLGIALGDPERAVNLVFPHATREAGPAISVRFNELPWPAELRVNLNNAGKVSALYLYRANF